jgi:hypothetical protein
MRNQTLYIDMHLTGLIPVKFIGWAKTPAHTYTGCYNAVVKIKRNIGAYKAGEVMHMAPWAVVQRIRRGRLIKNADLPPVDINNLIEARV